MPLLITEGFGIEGGSLAVISVVGFADRVELTISNDVVLNGAAAIFSNWLFSSITGYPSVATLVSVVGPVVSIGITPQTNGESYILMIPPIGVTDSGSSPFPGPFSQSYTAGGVAPDLYAIKVVDGRDLQVTFDKPVNSSDASVASNYSCDKGLLIDSATYVDAQRVDLVTSIQTPGTVYTLTTTNIRDLAGNS